MNCCHLLGNRCDALFLLGLLPTLRLSFRGLLGPTLLPIRSPVHPRLICLLCRILHIFFNLWVVHCGNERRRLLHKSPCSIRITISRWKEVNIIVKCSRIRIQQIFHSIHLAPVPVLLCHFVCCFYVLPRYQFLYIKIRQFLLL